MAQNGTAPLEPMKPLPANLPGPALGDRDAVADACFRAFASIDQCDEALLRSSVTADVHTDIAFKVCSGYDELRAKVWAHVSGNLDTVHYLTNLRVSIDSDGSSDGSSGPDGEEEGNPKATARVSFMAQAVHCVLGKGYEPDSPKFITGALYTCEAVRVEDEGLWKLRRMKSTPVWCTGDQSIMKPPNAK